MFREHIYLGFDTVVSVKSTLYQAYYVIIISLPSNYAYLFILVYLGNLCNLFFILAMTNLSTGNLKMFINTRLNML